MPILLDTGVLYAYYDRRDLWHRASRELIESELGHFGAVRLSIPLELLPTEPTPPRAAT